MKRKLFAHGNLASIIITAGLIVLPMMLTQCRKDQMPVNGDPIKFSYLTEEYAPFNYLENGQPNGVSVDILEALFGKMNLSIDRNTIQVLDWTTAYQTVLNQPNTMLFSTVRTTEREGLFKWVGPIAPQAEIILSLKNSGVNIADITDLNDYFTGVINGYSSIELLMGRGVLRPNLVIFNNASELYQALIETKQVQCIAYTQAGHDLMIQAMGQSAETYNKPYTIVVDQLYYAFNIKSADEMILKFQNGLDSFKLDIGADGSGGYDKILNRYKVIQHIEDNITVEMVINLVNQTSADLAEDAPGTITRINQGLAPYKDQSNPALYAFVYDTNVTLVAHAANPLIIGTSFKGKPDVAGKNFRDEIVAGALEHGTGWEDYIYTKPDQSGLYFKTTYYKLTAGSDSKQYIVCAGRFK